MEDGGMGIEAMEEGWEGWKDRGDRYDATQEGIEGWNREMKRRREKGLEISMDGLMVDKSDRVGEGGTERWRGQM